MNTQKNVGRAPHNPTNTDRLINQLEAEIRRDRWGWFVFGLLAGMIITLVVLIAFL